MNESKQESLKDLAPFHLWKTNSRTGQSEIAGVYDNAILEDIISNQPMFIIGGIPFIYRNGVFIADRTGAMLTSLIREHIYPVYRKANTERRIYEMFLRTECLQMPFEQMNCFPAHWVPFQNGMWDPIREKLFPCKPEFRSVNQLPIVFDPEDKPSGEVTEQWLSSFLKAADDREMFLQFYGYSLTPDRRQQVFMIFVGEGGSGKSTPLHLLEVLAGEQNVSNIALEQLAQRFASFGMFGKMINICADLKVTALEDTANIKKLTGEDRIFVESKGKDGFSFRSYAKLIFSTNELPIVKDERTNGFYRRLLVLTFPKPPEHPDPELLEKLLGEKDYFIHLCMDALHRMYQQGRITKSASSIRAVKRLRMDSDTVEAFLTERVTVKAGERADRSKLYEIYRAYCQKEERKELNRNSFYKALKSKGFKAFRTSSGRFISGINLSQPDWKTVTNDDEVVTESDNGPLPWEV